MAKDKKNQDSQIESTAEAVTPSLITKYRQMVVPNLMMQFN